MPFEGETLDPTKPGDLKETSNLGLDLAADDPNIRRKASVVAAVKNGAITLDDVCWLYDISVEEFLIWQEMIENHGIRGLRVTKLQDFRTS